MLPASSDLTRRSVRFGPYTLDLHTRELFKGDIRLKLHGTPVEVLAALVERPGDLVTRRELRDRLWGDSTFLDYENSLNNAVARLREALGDSADRARYIETLPKRGYRFVAPVDVIEAPRDHPQPQPAAVVPPEPPVPLAAEGLEPAGRPMWGAGQQGLLAAGLAVALVATWFVLVWPPLRGSETLEARIMLAVLPFENLSGSADHEYLADGFTEEMITQLARLDPERLGVIARTTAMNYKGARKTVSQIASELSVDYVLEGTIRESDGALRVTAQLIRSTDQTHMWAETFDRQRASLLDVERDVSRAVTQEVKLLLGPPSVERSRVERRPHPDAYTAYLRARYHHAQATVRGIESAIRFYRSAIELDSEFALAHAGLARAFIFGVRIRPLEALHQAHQSAVRALALAPELPEARLALAMTKLYYEWDWSGAEREFRRTILVDSGSPDAHFYYSHLLAALGRHDEAIAEARRAQQLDPHSTLIAHYVGRHLFMARRYEEALRELQRALELDPNYTWSNLFTFLTYEKLGRFDAALRHRQTYLGLIGRRADEVNELASRYAVGGYSGVIEKWMEITREYYQQSGHVTSAELVHGYAALGRRDEALGWLDRAFDDHTRDLIYLAVDPGYDPLREDPRYAARLTQMRLPATRAGT